MIHLHETILSERGRRAEVHAAIERAVAAGAACGLRLAGAWEAVIGPGKTGETVVLWEADGPDTVVELLRGQAAAARDWRAARAVGRRQTLTRLLWPAPITRSLAEHQAAGLNAHICVQETLVTTPGKGQEYMEALAAIYVPIAAGMNRPALGLWRTAFRNMEALILWAVKDWESVGLRQPGGRVAGEDLRDPMARVWTNVGLALRTDWDDRLLVSLPFSPLG